MCHLLVFYCVADGICLIFYVLLLSLDVCQKLFIACRIISLGYDIVIVAAVIWKLASHWSTNVRVCSHCIVWLLIWRKSTCSRMGSNCCISLLNYRGYCWSLWFQSNRTMSIIKIVCVWWWSNWWIIWTTGSLLAQDRIHSTCVLYLSWDLLVKLSKMFHLFIFNNISFSIRWSSLILLVNLVYLRVNNPWKLFHLFIDDLLESLL